MMRKQTVKIGLQMEFIVFKWRSMDRIFEMDGHRAEPRGYLAGTQTPDNMIHIVSSRLHYRFNLSWIEQ